MQGNCLVRRVLTLLAIFCLSGIAAAADGATGAEDTDGVTETNEHAWTKLDQVSELNPVRKSTLLPEPVGERLWSQYQSGNGNGGRGFVIPSVFGQTIYIEDLLASKYTPIQERFDAWQCMSYPVPSGQKSCVISNRGMRPGNDPETTGCGWRMPVFCNETINAKVVDLQAALPPGSAAPAGYTLYADVAYYKIHTELKTWAEAKAICEAEGDDISLAIPSTVAEYAAVVDMMNTVLPDEQTGIWMGFNDIEVEDDFKTVYGQPMCQLPLVLWNPQDPNNFEGNENCVGIGFNHADKLLDYNCDLPMAFMCEKPFPKRLTVCHS